MIWEWDAFGYLVVGLLIGYVLGKVENYVRDMRGGVLRLEGELHMIEDRMELRFRETRGLCKYAIKKIEGVEDELGGDDDE